MNNNSLPLLKVIVLGDSGVGKTALLDRFVNNVFRTRYKATIGADFVTQEIEVSKGRLVTLQIWDTAGQERFNSLGNSFYRGADCCIFVFDVSVPQTLKSLEVWKREFELQAEDSSTIYTYICIGNKIDLEDRLVTTEDGKRWCKDNGMLHYFETSAKTAENVSEAFKQAAVAQIARFDDMKKTRKIIDTSTEVDLSETTHQMIKEKSCPC